MGSSLWLIDLGLESPSVNESSIRPDLRQMATFFSGILFAASLYYFLHSPTLGSILSRFRRRKIGGSAPSLEAPQDTFSKTSTSMSTRLDPLSLVFILNLVYITTAATQFGSLLAFSSATGSVPCTFLMAWGALGSQTVRLIALLKLTVHLRERGATQWEKYALWGVLVLLTIVMFLMTAVDTAILLPIPQSEAFSLCYSRHFLLGAAVTRGMNLVIELYVLIRLISLLFPWIPAVDSKMQVARDVQIHRALSLIILDGATIYPSLFPTSLLADFAPFSVASLLVLMAFNYNTLPKQSIVSSILNADPASLPQSIRIPTPNFSPFLNLHSSVSSISKDMSVMDFTLDRRSGRSILVFTQDKEFPHPFAAGSITSVQHSARHWRSPNRAAGSLVEQSGSLSDSMRDAVVTTANRTRLYPAESPVLLMAEPGSISPREDEFSKRRRTNIAINGSPRRSFLPAMTPAPNGPRDPSDTKLPLMSKQLGRQILPQQVEVVDRMIAGSRHSHRGHLPRGSQSSFVLQDETMPPTPPVPPRTQRIIRQDPHPMEILSEENNNQGETSPSTTNSAVVFGSDILLRSQDDIMRRRRELVDGSGGTGDASAGHGSHRTDSGSFGDRVYQNSALSLQIASPSRRSFGASTNDADIIRPLSGQSQVRTEGDVLSIVNESLPSPTQVEDSPTSRRARDAHKRPTFGESLFDRFQRGFTLSDPPRSINNAEPSSSTTPAPRDKRESRPRSSRLIAGPRLRSSTVGSNRGAHKPPVIPRPST